MKITLGRLRQIIREVINQESIPLGKWSGNPGEPADEECLERLGGDVTVVLPLKGRVGQDRV